MKDLNDLSIKTIYKARYIFKNTHIHIDKRNFTVKMDVALISF